MNLLEKIKTTSIKLSFIGADPPSRRLHPAGTPLSAWPSGAPHAPLCRTHPNATLMRTWSSPPPTRQSPPQRNKAELPSSVVSALLFSARSFQRPPHQNAPSRRFSPTRFTPAQPSPSVLRHLHLYYLPARSHPPPPTRPTHLTLRLSSQRHAIRKENGRGCACPIGPGNWGGSG